MQIVVLTKRPASPRKSHTIRTSPAKALHAPCECLQWYDSYVKDFGAATKVLYCGYTLFRVHNCFINFIEVAVQIQL